MRTMILISGALALGLAACGQGGGEAKTDAAGGGAPSAAEMLNGPKPGLWRVTTEMSGMPAGAPAMAPVETCIQTASFEAPAGNQAPGAECTNQPFTRDGDAMVSSSTCTVQGIKADSTIRVTGDFNSRYVMTVNTKMDPAPAPNMAETTVTMTGERLGDCPAA
ncbi:DUF3617 domain-containing protein [Brevundimonas sp. GCM10030266]|uniref:DUF3617 domain-containing protein n=1 Tax=Brevundimonas sp. GCM10030266 TaxID=3273386 RepID=UPI00360A25D2